MHDYKTRDDGSYYAIAVTLVTLTLFAVLFSTVLETGRAFSQFRAIVPSWQRAQWLEYPGGSEILYARKNFTLTSVPDWAYLTVSALDDFIVYLNGQPLGKKKLAGESPSEIYDVTPLLQLGKNSVAIRSASEQRNLNARIIAELSWNAFGEHYILASNRDWRVEKRESFQRHGLLAWYQTDYEDSGWALAASVLYTSPDQTGHLSISEYALQKLQPRNWIGFAELQTKRVNLARTFNIDAATISGAWLGVSIDGNFKLSINNLVFAGIMGNENEMNYFSIAPYLKAGKNQIGIQIHSAGDRIAKAALSGFIITSNGEIEFSADRKWLCGTAPCRIVFQAFVHAQAPRLNPVSLTKPIAHTTQQWRQRITLLLLIFIGSLVAAGLFIPLLIARCGFGFPRACLVYGQPYGLSALLLAALIVVDADYRFDFSTYYPVYLPVLVIVFILILLFLPLIECSRQNKPFM